MTDITKEKKLEAIIVIAAGFLVLFYFFKVKYFWIISLAVLAAGAFSTLLTNWITWLWFKIAEVLGWVNSKIILFVVFYVFLTPISFLKKIFSAKKIQASDSNYKTVSKTYLAKDLENTW